MSPILLSAAACVGVHHAEVAIAKAKSLLDKLPGQKDLVNAILCCAEDATVEVEQFQQKKALRDLFHSHRLGDCQGDTEIHANYPSSVVDEEEDVLKAMMMPRPDRSEYVLRCQTPAPFYSRNIGREQMEAYPTPPSRMYAATDGKTLRLAMSICEAEL
ncbi:unnamed protein product [Choristocarpus tenellus]